MTSCPGRCGSSAPCWTPRPFTRGARPTTTCCFRAVSGPAAQPVREALDLVGLHDVATDRAGTFSLGMRQRLGIAVALLGNPQVLIQDEPIMERADWLLKRGPPSLPKSK